MDLGHTGMEKLSMCRTKQATFIIQMIETQKVELRRSQKLLKITLVINAYVERFATKKQAADKCNDTIWNA